MYRKGSPNLLARALNRISAGLFSAGYLVPAGWVTLEVPGRRTGNPVSFPLVVVDHDGERYLVSMLGADTNWVRNVRAAGMRAVLHHRGREPVRMYEVDPAATAPILRRYLEVAPGARPHIPVERGAPLAEFDRIAARFPVFRLASDAAER